MSGNKIFLDTNILIYLLQNNQDIIDYLQDKEIYISFVSELELLSFSKITEPEERILLEIFKNITIVEYSSGIRAETIKLRRKNNMKLPDAIILASSIVLKMPFYTADKRLKNIDENQDIVLFEF